MNGDFLLNNSHKNYLTIEFKPADLPVCKVNDLISWNIIFILGIHNIKWTKIEHLNIFKHNKCYITVTLDTFTW